MKQDLSLTKEQIHQYYQTAKLEIPKFSSWRVYKFRLLDGSFIQLPQVSSIDELRRYLLKYCPLDVWYSSCLFISPKNVKGKKSKLISENMIIGGDTVFDIDAENLEEAITESLILLEQFPNPSRITFTGKKGFHFVYELEKFQRGKSFFHKIKNYERNRKKLVKIVKSEIDEDITTDPYRVIRMPNTIHRSGRIATNIKKEDLEKGVEHILSKSRQIHDPITLKMLKDVREPKGNERGPPPTKHPRDSRADIRESLIQEISGIKTKKKYSYAQYQIKTLVPGINDRVVVHLKYKDKYFFKDLLRISNNYGLKNWHLLIYSDIDFEIIEVSAVCIKAIPFERAKKIYRFSKAINKDILDKYKTDWIPLDRTDYNPPNCLTFSFGNDKDPLYSLPHCEQLKKLGFDIDYEGKFIGSGVPTKFTALMR